MLTGTADKPLIILGIESSCDDTAAAVCVATTQGDVKIRSNVVSTQLRHAEYGGVIPELASRMHQVHIAQVVQRALEIAQVKQEELSAIAFTAGPGLLGSLLVGTSYAKGLALGLGIPLVQVNHMHGHVASLFLADPPPQPPLLCLTVSGGHTQLQIVRSVLDYNVVGRTLDDAAGEAFDKSAKLLGFAYPGGPQIDKHAQQGNAHFYKFPPPQVPGFDFSFSGLKTSILYYLRDQTAADPNFVQTHLHDLCASIQHVIVESLVDKTLAAAKHYGLKRIGIAGGVSANSGLRTRLAAACAQHGYQCYIPAFEYTTDNAAMIALAGLHLYRADHVSDAYTQAFATA
jgi:N6-L-threonylcarbamoyladenine synthase